MGPLATVDTVVAGINLDVNRELYMGPGKTMEFIVPDTNQLSKWRTLLVITSGFNRITGLEKTTGDGSEVIFQVADPDEVLRPVLATKELHARVEGIIYSVAKTPPVASSEAQVYTLTCKVRTLRTPFDNTK